MTNFGCGNSFSATRTWQATDACGNTAQCSQTVSVVDTTAAGDAFVGAMATALAEGKELRDAVKFANAAGAACCRAFGAQPALPSREEVEKLLAKRK